MTKLSKGSNPVFLKQFGIWFKASLASSPGTSFFPQFLIEASAKREWLVMKRKDKQRANLSGDTWRTV